jgi:hypothetical protein
MVSHVLGAQRASRRMWEAPPRQPLTRPTPIQAGQPYKEVHSRRRPGFPF